MNNFRIILVSNWDWDSTDPLKKALRLDDDYRLIEKFFTKNASREIREIKQKWIDHLQIPENTFNEFAYKLRFRLDHLNRRDFHELMTAKIELAGLTAVDDDNKATIYNSIASKFVTCKKTLFTKQTVLEECVRNGLINISEKTPKRFKVIGIRSFVKFTDTMEDECESFLCLTKYFEDRHVIDRAYWNKDIIESVRQFLYDRLTNHGLRSNEHGLILECVGSLAFVSGYILPKKSGAKLIPIQKGNQVELWKTSGVKNDDWKWDVSIKQIGSNNTSEVAVAISVTRSIIDDVATYLTDNAINVSHVVHYVNGSGCGQSCIQNGDHASHMADSLQSSLTQIQTQLKCQKIHLFFSAPNALMFYLGRCGDALGEMSLYEFDFLHQRTGSYEPSINIPL